MDHIGLHLKDIYFVRKTGLLSARGPGFQKQLYFQDGNLIFVKTNVPAEQLGDVLFRSKKIPAEVYEAIPGLLRPDVRIGETLVKNGLISQKDLYEGIVAQLTAVVLSLFPLFDAKISFQARSRFIEDNAAHEMKLPFVIAEGIRAMPFHPSLAEFFANKAPVAGLEGEIGCLNEDERSLLPLFDGKHRAEYVRDHRGESDTTFWKKLYLLYCLNLVELIEASFAVASKEDERWDADLKARLREAQELKKKLPQMDDFAILGVAPDAREDEVKKAYFKMARKYHPDLFGRNLDPEYRVQIDEVFDAVTKAYRNLLRNKSVLGAAATADAALVPKSASASRRDDAEKQGNPETLFRQGKTLFNQGRFEEAIGLLEEAARLKDDKAD
jgi:tetratricopeptide (TPR) repeat protein